MTVRGTPMGLLSRPSAATVRDFLAAQAKLDFTYPAVGATASTPPSGYVVDHTRIKLGEGEGTYRAARAALERWDQFRLGWVEAWPPGAPIRSGEVVASVARCLGLWWVNVCRIVYLVDEDGPVTRFGFANGTLPGHAEAGEERFLVEWDRASGEVWYDILAFSRPNRLLVRLGYPYMRWVQKRFGRDSAEAMVRAVKDDTLEVSCEGIRRP
jgi:uncharacterized protein (UPF0548 family)